MDAHAGRRPLEQELELREEWQDDGFPRPLPEPPEDSPRPQQEVGRNPLGDPRDAAPPTCLALSGGGAKKRLAAPRVSPALSRCDSAERSADDFSACGLSPDELRSLDVNLDALETPSDSETGSQQDAADWEWEDDLPREGLGEASGAGPAGTGPMELDQVDSRGRRWRRFDVGGQQLQVNMSVLEPYLHVLSHGGYHGDGGHAVILFTSCYLPEKTLDNYDYVMENLFRYMVGTLDLMVSEGYLLVYLCALTPRNKVPSIKWLHQCYTSIDRRLKKELKELLVVHPAWYIKALITLTKPFISEKFSRKIRFIQSLGQLSKVVDTQRLPVPDAVRQFDQQLNR